jgi:hypothetical protein
LPCLPCPQIVVGMLLKYVNLGSGWRHRLFVLQDGVLRYYKVRGCVCGCCMHLSLCCIALCMAALLQGA